jgi:hypothetical protein
LTDSATGKSYTLAGDTSKLSDHVGHQVRVTGSPGSGGDSSASSAGAGAGASSSAAGGTTFNVKKVKMISSSCSTSK